MHNQPAPGRYLLQLACAGCRQLQESHRMASKAEAIRLAASTVPAPCQRPPPGERRGDEPLFKQLDPLIVQRLQGRGYNPSGDKL